MKHNNNFVSWLCSGFTMLTSVAFEDVLRYILLVLGVISALVSLAYNVYCWYVKAKADGKITVEEVQEGVQIVQDGTEQIKEITKKKKGDK